jgi:galactokinase
MAATRAFWAPGRVNLIGEYTDVAGGLVLPVALELGIRFEGRPAERIMLRSGGAPGHALAAADGSDLGRATGWARYVAAVAAELADLGRPPVGLEGTLSSTLPAGAGLSSSAALEVAVATALCAVAGWVLEPLGLALACQGAELRAVGVPCGVMDQAASVLGRAGAAILLDTATLEHEPVALPGELALVVVDSGVSRTLEGSAYATRRRELDAALAALGGRDPRDLDADGLDLVEGLDETLRRRLRHVVTENRRVRETVAALAAGDADLLRELFRAGHESLRVDLEVSIPALDRLVELALRHGAVAARMTGGGFGGAIVALAEADSAAALGARIETAAGGGTAAFVCRAADGAREVPLAA